jgi:hypothetical protein
MQCRLNNSTSIYTAELYAIILAYKFVKRLHHDNFLIISDSMSSLLAIKNNNTHPFVTEMLQCHTELYNNSNKMVTLLWVPSHTGIRGNEQADKAAKAALQCVAIPVKIPYTDLRPGIQKLVTGHWQGHWDSFIHNKLYECMPTLAKNTLQINNRRDDIVLTRLKIGHTYITHNYLLKGEPQPVCTYCQCPYTVKHILLQCTALSAIRQQYYDAKDLYSLFNDILPFNILSFIKEIGLYNKI